MSEWKPIETAPKDGTQILIARAGDDVGVNEIEITEWFSIEQNHYERIKDDIYRKVTDKPIEGWNGNGHRATHWMPLPSPPKEQ